MGREAEGGNREVGGVGMVLWGCGFTGEGWSVNNVTVISRDIM